MDYVQINIPKGETLGYTEGVKDPLFLEKLEKKAVKKGKIEDTFKNILMSTLINVNKLTYEIDEINQVAVSIFMNYQNDIKDESIVEKSVFSLIDDGYLKQVKKFKLNE